MTARNHVTDLFAKEVKPPDLTTIEQKPPKQEPRRMARFFIGPNLRRLAALARARWV